MGFVIFILSLFLCVFLSIDLLHRNASLQIWVASFAYQDF